MGGKRKASITDQTCPPDRERHPAKGEHKSGERHAAREERRKECTIPAPRGSPDAAQSTGKKGQHWSDQP